MVMKLFKVIAAVAAALILSTSLQSASAQNSSTLSNVASLLTQDNGSSAGSALLGLYTQYKVDGKIDLSNVKNITNLVTLAKNIKGLSTQKNTTGFLSGLISGSKSLVSNSNSSKVLSTLSNISNLDLSNFSAGGSTVAKAAATSALSKLASKAKSSATKAVDSATDTAASKASSLLGTLFSSL